MAQKVIMTLTDDLDGSDAAETVTFSIDGSSYEMELSEGNATELREIFSPYRSAGRKLSGSHAGRRPKASAGDKNVRKWAAENGIEVNSRGRVKQEILQQYAAAMG
jgi:hypothetical protein